MARSGGIRLLLLLAMAVAAAFAVSVVARVAGDGSAAAGPTGRAVGELSQVRVEVLNGAGASGLARDATQRLRNGGFDVVYFGNAPAFGRGRSVVLDRVGHPDGARAVAASLEIDSVATAPDSTLLLDVTVILGEDWPPAERETGVVDRLRSLVEGHR